MNVKALELKAHGLQPTKITTGLGSDDTTPAETLPEGPCPTRALASIPISLIASNNGPAHGGSSLGVLICSSTPFVGGPKSVIPPKFSHTEYPELLSMVEICFAKLAPSMSDAKLLISTAPLGKFAVSALNFSWVSGGISLHDTKALSFSVSSLAWAASFWAIAAAAFACAKWLLASAASAFAFSASAFARAVAASFCEVLSSVRWSLIPAVQIAIQVATKVTSNAPKIMKLARLKIAVAWS